MDDSQDGEAESHMTYRVMILSDHAWRDVPACAIIKVELEKLLPDSEILIVDIHLLGIITERFHPHLVVVNHLHDPRRNKIFDSVKRRGGLIVVNEPEGRSNTWGSIKWATEDYPHELCDLYLCWGTGIAEHMPEDVKYEIVGGPRWDFYYPPYNQLIQSKEILLARYGLDATRPIVTVASSFPQGKFAKSSTDFLLRDWKNLKRDQVKGGENPAEHAKSELEAFNRFQSWLRTLRYEFPEYQLLIKPHPAENVAMWTKFADEIGASLMPMDYVFSLLALSDCHVARAECMTIPEAWIAGKPTVQCLLGNTGNEGPGMDAANLVDFFPPVTDVTGFLGQIETATSMISGTSQYQTEYLEKWLGPMPGSATRIAKSIQDLLDSKQPKTWKEPSYQDWVEIHGVLVQHSRDHAKPEADLIGQWSKHVRYEVTQDWVGRARRVSA